MPEPVDLAAQLLQLLRRSREMLGELHAFEQMLFIQQDSIGSGVNLLEPAFTTKIKFTFRVIRINIEGNIRFAEILQEYELAQGSKKRLALLEKFLERRVRRDHTKIDV